MIKFCIWDVGKVIYDFSFAPLDGWVRKHTSNLELYTQRRGKLDYNAYMRGKISFEKWCQNLCEFYAVPYFPEAPIEINQAMHSGISQEFPVTLKLMQENIKQGICNGILSNALPNLADCGALWSDLVPLKYRFTSFDLGMLKPDAEIYQAVQQKLGCKFVEIIFIDDKIENVEGAAKLGINAVLFNSATIEQNIRQIINSENVII